MRDTHNYDPSHEWIPPGFIPTADQSTGEHQVPMKIVYKKCIHALN